MTIRKLPSRALVTSLALAAVPAALAAFAGCDTQGEIVLGAGNGGSGASTTSHQGGSGASTGGTTQNGGNGGAGNHPNGCVDNGDCSSDPGGPVCDPATGNCVVCLPDGTGCSSTEYCDPVSHDCVTGCATEQECVDLGFQHCDLQTHQCVICLTDDDCLPGTVCSAERICEFGCNANHDCPAGLTCCTDQCKNLVADPDNCGQCGHPCPGGVNTVEACLGQVCASACIGAFADCNGDLGDGCEWNTILDGPCLCAPGSTQPCYQGTPGTENVGPCHGGTQTCDPSGTSWGACLGQVLPHYELCANAVDEDCNNVVDDVVDMDGDGWTTCNGDCCDVASASCPSPRLVNPGALEALNDGIDNDCDPATSDSVAPAACSNVADFTAVTATQVAQAMDLCQTTTANPPMASRKWGLISAVHRFANGATPNATDLASLQNNQTAILTAFGTGGVVPKKGATLGVISSGMARDANDAGWVLPIAGTTFTSAIGFPGAPPLSTYVNAHGGGLVPGQCAGTTCPVGTGANDSVNIRLSIRTPTNAQGFSYDFRFYSAEYQTYQCTTFNDYYLAMLTSGAPAIPADHQISFDALNNAVSVNNGFFQDCGGNGKNCGPCPFGTASLAGTGFDQVQGGSTEWLTTDAPIVPGETITLELVVFDVSDHIYDTLVLLDNFRWSLSPVVLGTHT
ncbi:MAG: choice-of-anchor L domain-containing protein [Polyangiaceae bacterium]|nr:choice-of-anchor L domain-containing protein [Polyangiaceae bacterium]